MKLPRWLSPVRMVEAETGWPRTVCRRYLRAKPCLVMKGRWIYLWLGCVLVIMFVIMPLCGMAIEALLPPMVVPESDEPLVEKGWWAVLLHILPPLAMYTIPIIVVWGCLIGALMLGGLHFLSALALPQYVVAPWCFKCKYPIPRPIDARPCANCPECGEPIPPEIATLAAKHAKQRTSG